MNRDKLQLELGPSVYHCSLLIVCHGIAIASLFLTQMSIYFQAAIAFTVLVSLVFYLHRYGLLRDRLSVVSLDYQDERWTIGLRSGEKVVAKLQSPLFVLSFLVVLSFKDAKKRKFPVVVFPDSVSETQMRHCRVFLHFGRL